MPRTATGKILHRVLRDRMSSAESAQTSPDQTVALKGPDMPDLRQDLNADPQSVAAWIARFLKARGVDRIFGLQGGHIQPIWDHAARPASASSTSATRARPCIWRTPMQS